MEIELRGEYSQELHVDGSVTYSKTGNPTIRVELWHEGLDKHRVFTGKSETEVERKVEQEARKWESQWEAIQETNEAIARIEALKNTLAEGVLSDPIEVDWDAYKDREPFSIAPPVARPHPEKPVRDSFNRKLGLFAFFSPAKRQESNEETERLWQNACKKWSRDVDNLDKADQTRLDAWLAEKNDYLQQQREQHAELDRHAEGYPEGVPDSIEQYFRKVLEQSQYPEWMPQNAELECREDTLVVSYDLPALGDLPRLKEVAFVASRGERREKYLTDAQAAALYDSVVYQIALRTLHEIYAADYARVVSHIAFNGYVTAINPAVGKMTTTCIVSLHVSRDELDELNLVQVDPKACFKALKGVGSSKLHRMVAVAPIVGVSREDSRFVTSQEVADSMDESTNLAVMDWEDFEHLTRELFDAEFATAGGEVKVTQSSRDGGVDAIAFDPDPIRGGKIVIQAKRYTNTVGVTAVRDLYGTLINEGAMKGVLVTTSDYGPDAYSFAKDKPITLVNGSNLLHMLEKHGHRARIDIEEAKQNRE